MRFSKPPTSHDQQIALLEGRGMACENHELAKRWLITVGYYRLSAYWLPYEAPPGNGTTRSKRFGESVRFEDIISIYTFDRRLRLLVMEAIERIEVALRASWTYHMAHAYGPHAHMNPELFVSGFEHARMLAALSNRSEHSREKFIEHYREKYTAPYLPPLWAVTETMTFTDLSKWVAATSDHCLRQSVAKDLGLPSKEVMDGVLQAFALVRNICAHHGRLWNRRLVKGLPTIKKLGRDMQLSAGGASSQASKEVFNVLVVLVFLTRHQAKDTTFPARLGALVEEVTDQQRGDMGFPPDWRERPAWQVQ